jgi:hypothetical protein
VIEAVLHDLPYPLVTDRHKAPHVAGIVVNQPLPELEYIQGRPLEPAQQKCGGCPVGYEYAGRAYRVRLIEWLADLTSAIRQEAPHRDGPWAATCAAVAEGSRTSLEVAAAMAVVRVEEAPESSSWA